MDIWLELLFCLILIAVAGYRLSVYGDILAEKLGWSRSWIGLVLVASVTSLPELVTGVSSVTAAQTPDIAVGDVLGSCVFNLMLIVVLDFLSREESVYTRAHVGHTLSAGFGVVLIGFVAINLLLAQSGLTWALGHVGAYTPLILLFYVLSMRTLYLYERGQRIPLSEAPTRHAELSLRQAAQGYALAAVVVVAAGVWLPFVGKALALHMGWGESFVGTLFVAMVTSMPEAVVTVAALRLGAIDMALGNLFGSNLFNVAILVVDDLLYLPGPLLSSASPAHAVSALSAVVMSGVAIIGLFYRPRKRVFKTVGWASLLLLSAYLLNVFANYLYGR